MAEPLAKKLYYSKEEYLEMEAAAAYKSEYYQGEIFAMSGGTRKHSIICINLYRIISDATYHNDCVLFESNMKLEIAEADAYVYPDLMVVCGDMNIDEDTADPISNPILVIEVLSPGTESFDRGLKFEYYKTVPTLKEYVLVSQNKPKIEAFFRGNKNLWTYTVIEGLDKTFLFRSIEYEVALRDIYHKVRLT